MFFYFSSENACVKECIVKSAELINSLIRYFNIVCVFRGMRKKTWREGSGRPTLLYVYIYQLVYLYTYVSLRYVRI